MILADFFLHETQYSRPMLGIAPSSELRREIEVLADSTFLTYLRDEALSVQLLRVYGADFELLATLRLPLAALLTDGQTSVKAAAAELRSPSGSLVGRIDVCAEIEGGSIAAQAKAFMEGGGGGEGVGRITDATVQVLVCLSVCLSIFVSMCRCGGVEVSRFLGVCVGVCRCVCVSVFACVKEVDRGEGRDRERESDLPPFFLFAWSPPSSCYARTLHFDGVFDLHTCD